MDVIAAETTPLGSMLVLLLALGLLGLLLLVLLLQVLLLQRPLLLLQLREPSRLWPARRGC